MASGTASILLSVAMIAVLLLGAGGMWMVVRGRDARKGVLMLIAALVLLGNVLIWTV